MGKRAVLESEKQFNFLIIGGHSPIALAIANRLVSEGKVFLCTRKIDSEIRSNASREISLIESDLESLVASFEERSSTLKGINAIIFAHRYRGDANDIESAFKCEVIHPFDLVKKMIETSGSESLKNIIFFTSPAAKKILGDQPLAYHLTKTAVSHLVRFLAIEFARKNISVIGISPSSFVAKARSEEFYRSNKTLKAKLESRIPSRKFVTCEEIAELVYQISTSDNLSLSGNILELDHGFGLLEASTLIRDTN
jgi:NAD(P)-dependent dehydrogenase (short-subunit alcohol dehydrogenase family)